MKHDPPVNAGHPAPGLPSVVWDQIRLLHEGLPVAAFGNLLIGMITLWVLKDAVAWWPLAIWFSAFAAVQGMRFGLWLAIRYYGIDPHTVRWIWLLRGGALLTGAAWGALPVILYPAELPYQVFLPFVAAGVTGAAVAALSIDRVSALSFILPALVPLVTRLLLEGGEIQSAMGLMVLLYLAYLVMAVGRGARTYARTQHLLVEADQRDEDLRQSEQRWQFALEGSGDGVWDWNAQTNKVFFSRRWKEMLGYAEEEIGDTLAEWDSRVHPDDKAACYEDLDRHFRGDTSYYVNEHRVRCKDGHYKWILDRGQVIERTPDGKPLRVIGTHTDITGRKRIEQELQESQTRYQQLIEEIGDKFVVYSHSPTDGTLFYVSNGFEAVFGVPKAQALGRAWADVIAWQPGVVEQGHDIVARLVEGKLSYDELEMSFTRPDGRIGTIHVTAHAVQDAAGKAVRIDGIAEDITERKKVERLKNEFISTVSHELRTPLTSIRGALGLIAGGAAGVIPDKAREMVDIAYKNSERLSRLINDILDIEKIESGRMTFEMQPHRVAALVDQSLAAFRAYAEQHRVRFVVDGKMPDAEIRVDAGRFMQIMANLLSNAVKFSPPGDQVGIAVSVAGSRVRVTVSDQGPGIPDDFREHVFEKFSQADASDSRHKGGSGLGLNIARMMVERMDGQIGFDSKPGSGTVFQIDFPLLHRQPRPAPRGTVAGEGRR